MLSQIKNYNTFYGVVLACAMLSNDDSDAYRRDASAIVDLYCRARGVDEETIAEWKACIFDVLGKVSVLDERTFGYNDRAIRREYEDVDLLYDVKSDVISEISSQYRQPGALNSMFVNPAWFDYSHIVVYHPAVRYRQMQSAASSGWRVAARELGLMRALGIGCERDYAAAKRKFLQGTYWCDTPSCILLAYLCRIEGDEEGARLYGDLATLLKNYLKEGLTVIPADAMAQYAPRAVVTYGQIASIYRDICCDGNRYSIDYSFVEVMMSEDISDKQKMAYINNYGQKTYKEAINPSFDIVKPIGFKGGNHGE